jgi:hypothetical protein
MSTITMRSLLAVSILLAGGCASGGHAGGYQHPRLASLGPSVKTVAIVPFHFGGSGIDSVDARLIGDAVRQGAYATLADGHRQNRYTTTLQALAVTDSLLARAGIDPVTVLRRTHAELGRILGVDAILRGAITEYSDPGFDLRVGAALLSDNLAAAEGKVACTYTLFEVRTGAMLWSLIDDTRGGFLRGGAPALRNAGESLADAFPLRR